MQHVGKNIYGASMKTFTSYAVKSPTEIAQNASHPIGGHRTSQTPSMYHETDLMFLQPKPAVQIARHEQFSF